MGSVVEAIGDWILTAFVFISTLSVAEKEEPYYLENEGGSDRSHLIIASSNQRRGKLEHAEAASTTSVLLRSGSPLNIATHVSRYALDRDDFQGCERDWCDQRSLSWVIVMRKTRRYGGASSKGIKKKSTTLRIPSTTVVTI